MPIRCENVSQGRMVFETSLRRSNLRLDAVKRYRSGMQTPYSEE